MKIRVPLCLFHIETSIKRAYQSESLFHYHPNATIKSKTSPAENYALPYSFYSFADNKTLSSNCEPDIINNITAFLKNKALNAPTYWQKEAIYLQSDKVCAKHP